MDKEEIIEYLNQEKDCVKELKKISAFVDLILIETLKKEKNEKLPFMCKQILSLKDYIISELSFYLTQEDNVNHIKKETLRIKEEAKKIKKKEESEEELLNQENLLETDQLILQKEEER